MKDIKTPLRYPGGKSSVTKFLFKPEHLPDCIKEYREPFLGGGSCAIAFSKKFPDIPVWVNDKYYNLYCFWVTLQNESEQLIQKIHEVKTDLETSDDPMQKHLDYYKVLREGLNNADDPFDIAWRFYIMNRCSFSGLGESTGSFSKDACMKLFNHRLIEKLKIVSHITQNWKITNLDYSELFDDDPESFVFADPPYDINSFIYGNKGDMHDTFDHKEFHDVADASKNKVMITYNSNETLHKAFSNWHQKVWNFNYTMVSTKKYRKDQTERKELLLTNYEMNEECSLEGFFA